MSQPTHLVEWMASFQGSHERQLLFPPNQSEFRRLHYPIFTRALSPLVKDKPSILATLNPTSLFLNNCKLPCYL